MVPRCGVDGSNVSKTPLAKDIGIVRPVDTVESFERCIISQAIAAISIGINQDKKVVYLLQTYLLWLAKPPSREFSISRLIWSAAK